MGRDSPSIVIDKFSARQSPDTLPENVISPSGLLAAMRTPVPDTAPRAGTEPEPSSASAIDRVPWTFVPLWRRDRVSVVPS
jgi:hypothetical protein